VPKVGGRHFSYSKKGQVAAKKYARKVSKKVVRKKQPAYK